MAAQIAGGGKRETGQEGTSPSPTEIPILKMNLRIILFITPRRFLLLFHPILYPSYPEVKDLLVMVGAL